MRKNDLELEALLYSEQISTHPFIIGEIALGNLRNRKPVLQMLNYLSKAIVASDDEMSVFIENHHLYGKGIGHIDAHLLASALLTKTYIWTKDKKLKEIAMNLGCAYVKH